jgi:EipB-like
VADVRGVMSYEFAEVCDGWTTVQRVRMKFLYQDGRTTDVGWNLSSWESKDGARYRFFMRNLDGSAVTSELKGEARLKAPGQEGVVNFEEPKQKKLTLPRGTLFPTGHSLALLQHAAKGDAAFLATVFDGSDDSGPMQVSAVLAGRVPPTVDEAKLSPLLSVGPVYRMGLAFFPLGGEETTPEQEQTVSIYANGVIDRLTLDYGNFRLDAVLKKLEALPIPGC